MDDPSLDDDVSGSEGTGGGSSASSMTSEEGRGVGAETVGAILHEQKKGPEPDRKWSCKSSIVLANTSQPTALLLDTAAFILFIMCADVASKRLANLAKSTLFILPPETTKNSQ